MAYRSTGSRCRARWPTSAQCWSGAITEKSLTLDGPQGEADVIAWADAGPRATDPCESRHERGEVHAAGGSISLSCAVDDDTVVAHVADTGPGSQAELESIFDPFVQLTAGLMDRQGGVGLG